MYTTLITRTEKYDDVTDLALLSRTISQTSYSRSISYSARADTINGITQLIEPVTETFTSSTDLKKLLGMYIDFNDTIYCIPTDATFSQVSISGSLGVTGYVIRASKARKMHVIGFRVSTGTGPGNHVRKCDFHGLSNDDDDLMLGSVCSSWIEATIHSTEGDFAAYEGDELTVYKVAPDGTENQTGVFNITEAKWISRKIYKITAYDNVIKLDRDITGWLRGLTGWPYALTEFYGMLATECGLESGYRVWDGASSFMVHKFDVEDGTTGRELMGTICEAMGDYCIALPDGTLSANWYRTDPTRVYYSKSFMPGTNPAEESFYYGGSLSYGDFDVEDVRYVQIQEDRSKDAVRWPDYGPDADVSNAYIITGNLILMAHPTYKTDEGGTDTVRNALTQIAARFDYTRYRPFKLTMPEAVGFTVGKYVYVGDANNDRIFISPITNITWKGNRMTLECTARRTREDTDSFEHMSNKEIVSYTTSNTNKAAQEQKEYTDKVLERTTQADLFAKLAGSTPGLLMSGGQIYTDRSFKHNGLTVKYYPGSMYAVGADTDETALEAFLEEHLTEMESYSTRELLVSTGAINGAASYRTTLFKYSNNYAVITGDSYSNTKQRLYKRKYGGTWEPAIAFDIQPDLGTVSVSNHYFNDQSSSDETAFETWLSNQHASMADMSVRDVAFRCKAAGSSDVLYGRLCRHNANYAVLYGFDYGGKMLYKRLYSGTWQASKTQTIGG